jgi:small subunit ribosomal protein S18
MEISSIWAEKMHGREESSCAADETSQGTDKFMGTGTDEGASAKEETAERRAGVPQSWLDVQALSRFVSETGKIQSRQYTRLTAKEQRQMARLVKRARNMLLMK